MKIELWFVGKTNEAYLEAGIALYEKRLVHYGPFSIVCIPDVKVSGKMAPDVLKAKEGALVLSKIKPEDFLVLLDERGKQHTSRAFAAWIEQRRLSAVKRVIFLIGGAFGFSEDVYDRANSMLSLSAMTFSHQMIRLFFVEQLYRAMTILRNEGYHND